MPSPAINLVPPFVQVPCVPVNCAIAIPAPAPPAGPTAPGAPGMFMSPFVPATPPAPVETL